MHSNKKILVCPLDWGLGHAARDVAIVKQLTDLGHEVIEVHSGKAALEVMAARPDIDRMLTDQARPKMPGVELARQVRARRPDLPIILATGYAEMPEGGADYITVRLEKPFSDAALSRTLDEVR